MKKLMIALTAAAAMGSLALMPTEASAQRVGRGGAAVGAVRGGGMAFRGGYAGYRGGYAGYRGGWHRGGGWGWGAGAAAVGLGLGLAAAGAYPYYGAYGYYPAYDGCYLQRQWTPYGVQLVRVCQ